MNKAILLETIDDFKLCITYTIYEYRLESIVNFPKWVNIPWIISTKEFMDE